METYTLNVAGLQRELPKVKIHDELAIASFVMFGDTELIEACAEQLILHTDFPNPISQIDILCCPEAKGIPLVHAVARRLNILHEQPNVRPIKFSKPREVKIKKKTCCHQRVKTKNLGLLHLFFFSTELTILTKAKSTFFYLTGYQ